MANTFRKVYKKTGNSGSASDYQLVGNVGVDGVELDIMQGATEEVEGDRRSRGRDWFSTKTNRGRRKLYLNWGWCVESD